MMGRGKMKDFDNGNGFFDKHKDAGKNDDDGRLGDGEGRRRRRRRVLKL